MAIWLSELLIFAVIVFIIWWFTKGKEGREEKPREPYAEINNEVNLRIKKDKLKCGVRYMKCPYCSAKISTTKFCPECGKEIDTGLTEEQTAYLKRKKTAHTVGAVAGGIVGGAGLGLGIFGIIGGILLIIFGILLSITIIGAIIGIPMIIYWDCHAFLEKAGGD